MTVRFVYRRTHSGEALWTTAGAVWWAHLVGAPPRTASALR